MNTRKESKRQRLVGPGDESCSDTAAKDGSPPRAAEEQRPAFPIPAEVIRILAQSGFLPTTALGRFLLIACPFASAGPTAVIDPDEAWMYICRSRFGDAVLDLPTPGLIRERGWRWLFLQLCAKQIVETTAADSKPSPPPPPPSDSEPPSPPSTGKALILKRGDEKERAAGTTVDGPPPRTSPSDYALFVNVYDRGGTKGDGRRRYDIKPLVSKVIRGDNLRPLFVRREERNEYDLEDYDLIQHIDPPLPFQRARLKKDCSDVRWEDLPGDKILEYHWRATIHMLRMSDHKCLCIFESEENNNAMKLAREWAGPCFEKKEGGTSGPWKCDAFIFNASDDAYDRDSGDGNTSSREEEEEVEKVDLSLHLTIRWDGILKGGTLGDLVISDLTLRRYLCGDIIRSDSRFLRVLETMSAWDREPTTFEDSMDHEPEERRVRRRRAEDCLLLTRVLMKYLEQKDPDMHATAKKVIMECARKNKAGDPDYAQFAVAVERELKAAVPDAYYQKARTYLLHFLEQKRREGQLGHVLHGQFILNATHADDGSQQQGSNSEGNNPDGSHQNSNNS